MTYLGFDNSNDGERCSMTLCILRRIVLQYLARLGDWITGKHSFRSIPEHNLQDGVAFAGHRITAELETEYVVGREIDLIAH